MKPSVYGPYPYIPIVDRQKFQWSNGARLALWVIPNIEFFPLNAPVPGRNNERISLAQAKIPDVSNWAARDYGNRVGIWRFMRVMSNYGVRGTAALNSDICDHHPQIVDAVLKLDWEIMGHCQSNSVRLNQIEPERERETIRDTLDRIAKATGKRPIGWLSAGVSESWNTLEHLIEEGCLYVADWASDDLPYRLKPNDKTIFSIPYTRQCNDNAQFFDQKVPGEGFETLIKRQFDWLYREAAEAPRVMSIGLHPFVTGAAYRIGALDRGLDYICSHAGVWLATGEEIVRHYAQAVSDV